MDGAPSGLTAQEARERRARFGANTLEANTKPLYLRLLFGFLRPIPLLLIAASALSFLSGKPEDGWIIAFLFVTNAGIQAWHERKADAALEALRRRLTIRVRALRDGAWLQVPSTALVPDDCIELVVGSVVPADVEFLETSNLSLNESAITGESLPRERGSGESGYAGSFVVTGRALARVSAIGSRTYFGKALREAKGDKRRSALERDILTISRFLSAISIAAIIGLSVLFWYEQAPLFELLALAISLLIAGIPVALPTVMSIITSVGVLNLAKKHAIVRRMSALEDLANVDLLLSDKTGTLTENRIGIDGTVVFGSYTKARALGLALAAAPDRSNPMDAALLSLGAHSRVTAAPALSVIPGDSERKRATAIVLDGKTRRAVSLGAPQVIASHATLSQKERALYERTIAEAAAAGKRVLALAISDSEEEKGMHPVALFLLADGLRPDTLRAIGRLGEEGIAVKMLTGDTYEIAANMAQHLKLPGSVYRREVFDDESSLSRVFEDAAGFAEVLPSDKYRAVLEARKRHTVAVTGDGVNDVPPVSSADVGIAVQGAVDALRESADIALATSGLSVIGDAILEARKIFMRLYHYSVFRISESFRVIITIAVIGFLFKEYPLTPVQLILLALLNDLPVVTIAFDKVKVPRSPAAIQVKRRFLLSTLFGAAGILNSLLVLMLAVYEWHLPWGMIQTLFFLKLVVSGHMLMYVAHTDERWWRFLPNGSMIAAITTTQVLASGMALAGVLTTALPLWLVAFVWVWSFFWMQVSELAKIAVRRLYDGQGAPTYEREAAVA